MRLDLQHGRHHFIHEAFGRGHLSGLQDGHERMAWHIGPHLQTEVTIHLWREVTGNVWFAAEVRNQRHRILRRDMFGAVSTRYAKRDSRKILFFYFLECFSMPQMRNARLENAFEWSA